MVKVERKHEGNSGTAVSRLIRRGERGEWTRQSGQGGSDGQGRSVRKKKGQGTVNRSRRRYVRELTWGKKDLSGRERKKVKK